MKKKICIIAYFTIFVFFLLHVALKTDMKDFINADKTGKANDYSDGWTLEDGETVNLDDVSEKGFGKGLIISKTLPDEMLETDAVCFSTSNLKFRVYVDEQLIYYFDTQKNLTGSGDGISYHMIGLGTKDEGDTIKIEGESVFSDGYGGRINDIQFGSEEQFRYYVMRHNLLGFVLSYLMILFGVGVIIFFFSASAKNKRVRPFWALGTSAIIFGLWSLCDTGIPQFLTGSTVATRELVYLFLHYAGFPMIYFVNYITKQRRQIYIYCSFLITFFSIGGMMSLRYYLGADMHTMAWLVYGSYVIQLGLLIIMFIDNEIYCRKKGISSDLKYFYTGGGLFVASSIADMLRYLIGKKGSIGHGSFFRLGLVLFFIFLAFQLFYWLVGERTSLERDRFVNRLLQYIMGSMDPETKIKKVLEYLCEELHADRAYIFEDKHDGTFENTYEYCTVGVTPEIDNLKSVPFEGTLDVWYEEYKKGGHVLIYDIEKYRKVSQSLYDVLKPQGIETLVTGPLILEGEYIGFFGVDNPPPDAMKEVSEIIRLLMFFLSELVAGRDNHKKLVEFSYQDALTGVGNRRAISEYEKTKLDTSHPYGFIMCDINGLKSVNDNEGHEAGDELIVKVASTLSEVFGHDSVYRMGGDEFAVYVSGMDQEELIRRIGIVRSSVEKDGRHVAVGYSYDASGNPDYNALKLEADNKMYDEKRKFYSNENDRRKGEIS